MCARAVHTGRAATCPPPEQLYLQSDYHVIYLFSFSSFSSLTQPSNFLITNPFLLNQPQTVRQSPEGGCAKFAHTPTSPDQGQQQKQESCMCKKVDLGTRIAEFTEQRRLSSDAKATKSCKRKLSRSTRTPRAASCRETADQFPARRWSGGGRARERARSTYGEAAAARSPAPSSCP